MKARGFFSSAMGGLILVVAMTLNVNAQYSTAIGLRFGGTSGVDVKYFYQQEKAFEGIIGTFGNGVSFTGLIEKYVPVYNAKGLYTYYGGGAHLAFYNGKDRDFSYFGRQSDYHRNNDVGLGINGIVGIEYHLPEGIPISFSLDLKPFIEFGTGGYVVVAPDPSFGVKFIIK
ncbi:hypothetical protein WSM22_35270 [Cytophagales bacterium WSM2-2]|nr:hypothetical protein WSM22_35270 [Cytophagales bacterium WSM2-2]